MKEKIRNHAKRGRAFSFSLSQTRITEGNPATPTKEKAWHDGAGLHFIINLSIKNKSI
jgi:hypothetical protein